MAYGSRQPDYLEAAQIALGNSDFVRSVQLASEGLSFSPFDTRLLTCRGHAYFQLKDYPRALADYSQVIKLSAHDAKAYACRGICYSEMKYHDQAVRRQVAEVSARGAQVALPMVQAFDQLMSTKYDGDAYAATILSFEPALGRDIPRLREIGLNVSRLKGRWPDDPQLQVLARIFTREIGERHRRVRIPPTFTGGPVAYLADVWIFRPFLPLGKLRLSDLLYCIAEPGDVGRLELLPQPLQE